MSDPESRSKNSELGVTGVQELQNELEADIGLSLAISEGFTIRQVPVRHQPGKGG